MINGKPAEQTHTCWLVIVCPCPFRSSPRPLWSRVRWPVGSAFGGHGLDWQSAEGAERHQVMRQSMRMASEGTHNRERAGRATTAHSDKPATSRSSSKSHPAATHLCKPIITVHTWLSAALSPTTAARRRNRRSRWSHGSSPPAHPPPSPCYRCTARRARCRPRQACGAGAGCSGGRIGSPHPPVKGSETAGMQGGVSGEQRRSGRSRRGRWSCFAT